MNAKLAKRLRRISRTYTEDAPTAYVTMDGTIQLQGMTTKSFYRSIKKKWMG